MDDEIKETIVYEKEGFKFIKKDDNFYHIHFIIENTNYYLPSIIDFNLIKLIYQLNNDIYENVDLETINQHEAIITIIMKHFFADIGLPQKYSFLHMTKIINDNSIIFSSQSIKSYRPENISNELELMAIESMISKCNIINPHKIEFMCDILFDMEINIPKHIEKIVGIMINKIFMRVKQFIENMTIK